MQICKYCYIPMVSVMSFSKDRHEQFCRCPRCYGETKHQGIGDDDLNFGEVLHKEYQKQRS